MLLMVTQPRAVDFISFNLGLQKKCSMVLTLSYVQKCLNRMSLSNFTLTRVKNKLLMQQAWPSTLSLSGSWLRPH